MASRRIVSALHLGKKEQFAKHIQALNQSFHDWFHEQMKIDPAADYTDGFQVCVYAVIVMVMTRVGLSGSSEST